MRESQNSVQNESKTIGRYYRIFPGGKTVLLSSSRLRGAGADNSRHRRDERFKDRAHYKARPDPRNDKAHPKKPAKCYGPADFTHDAVAGTFICLAGKLL